MITERYLKEFLVESNRIEGYDTVDEAEVIAATQFLEKDKITIEDLEHYVKVTTTVHGIRHTGVLRERPGQDVRIGSHIPMRGGGNVVIALQRLLDKANAGELTARQLHIEYELLHPFTDGNGRSGRLLWLWRMDGRVHYLFLQSFYYQVLANAEAQR